MTLSLQGRSHRFKSCSAHKGFSEIYSVKNQKEPQKREIVEVEKFLAMTF